MRRTGGVGVFVLILVFGHGLYTGGVGCEMHIGEKPGKAASAKTPIDT